MLWVVLVALLLLVSVQKGAQVELTAAYGELSAVQAHWMARAGVERAISTRRPSRICKRAATACSRTGTTTTGPSARSTWAGKMLGGMPDLPGKTTRRAGSA